MRVRQVGCDQGSCDVGVAMCLRPSVFVCVFVFLGRMYHGCGLRYIFEMKSKEVSNCQGKCCQREFKCRSVS